MHKSEGGGFLGGMELRRDALPREEPARTKWYRLRQDGTRLLRYLLDSEVHTYAFSVSANAILSFIPLIVLLYTLAENVFHSALMSDVIHDMIFYFFPANQKFITTYLPLAVPHHSVQLLSIVFILISCTGIFLPLEVALNQAWGVKVSRNYIMNQLVAFGLAILMVALGMTSIALNALARQLLTVAFFGHTENFVFRGLSESWLALSTGAASIVFFFSIYWLLPNCEVPWRSVLKTSVVTGLVWLAAKYIFVLVLPHMELQSLYGPFYVSVGLLFWAYISGLILFAGAQLSVNRTVARRNEAREG